MTEFYNSRLRLWLRVFLRTCICCKDGKAQSRILEMDQSFLFLLPYANHFSHKPDISLNTTPFDLETNKSINNTTGLYIHYMLFYPSALRNHLLEKDAGQISLTRPTMPLSRRTFIPWGWTEERVNMFLTMPSVNFPDRWSGFKTTKTRCPGLMSARSVTLILMIFPLF